ncbi:hypothetical protein E4U13_008235 [Claviceps humidiphila]|uniref:Uncharacterized protein n=1 Tax=Claviceps humidiphila TaxID=1294629 RepID=A0A9P7TRQ6_9HYPO|nr:hypothetical protein E4U13_008235 [Claviceps humidiphila]
MSSTVDEIYAREHQTEASPSLSHGLLNIWVSTQRSSNINLWQPTPSGVSSLFQTVTRTLLAVVKTARHQSRRHANSTVDQVNAPACDGLEQQKKEDNAANLTAQDFHD